MMNSIQCFSFAMIIASWTINGPTLPLPGPKPNASASMVFGPTTCNSFAMPETQIVFNDTNYLIAFDDHAALKCQAPWGKETAGKVNWLGKFDMVLDLSKGKLDGVLERNDPTRPCIATKYSLGSCGLNVTIPTMKCSTDDPLDNPCEFWMHDVAKSILDKDVLPLLCPTVYKVIGDLMTNHTPVPDTPLPPMRAGSPPLIDNAYIRMANKIVDRLPLIDDMRISLSVSNDSNSAHFGINAEHNVSLHKTEWPLLQIKQLDLILPRGIALNLDLVLQYFVCVMHTGSCKLSGLGLYNMRLRGFNDEDMSLDRVFSWVASSIIDPLLTPPEDNNTTVNNTLNFTLFPSKPMEGPPAFVYGLIGIVPAFFFVLLSALSVRYHLLRAHIIEKQNEARSALISSDLCSPLDTGRTQRVVMSYSVLRGVGRDVLIAFLCNLAMIMFVWANATTAVTVSLAGEVRIFAFSLQNSVHDFWVSGLKALAFFIALFSGCYPYVKLIVICFMSIVHRNTKSKVLRVVDSMGRYSFLDSFVMMVLVTTLQVPGIAEVTAHPPFYSFIGATVISMVAGNLATHTYDPGLIVDVVEAETFAAPLPKSEPRLISAAADGQTKINNSSAYGTTGGDESQDHHHHHINKSNTIYDEAGGGGGGGYSAGKHAGEIEDAPELEIAPELEKPTMSKVTLVAILLFGAAGSLFGIWFGWFHAPLRYKFHGFVTVLKGEYQDYSLHRLFYESPGVLGAVATVTIVALPTAMVLFPHDKFLSYVAPWCSTDVFLLTCLAALLQLHDFIKYQAGPILGMMINASAQLQTPFYFLGVSAVFQWVYIVRAAMGHEPNHHRNSNGKPSDDDAPPWLCFKQ